MQALYITAARTPVILSLGMLFGLGINWFLGALVAVHAESLTRSPDGPRSRAEPGCPCSRSPSCGTIRPTPAQGIYLDQRARFHIDAPAFPHAENPGSPPVQPDGSRCRSTWLGLSSYPTYLFHGPIIMLVGSAILRWGLIRTGERRGPSFRSRASRVGVALGLLPSGRSWPGERHAPSVEGPLNRARRERRPASVIEHPGINGKENSAMNRVRSRFTNFGPYHLARLRALAERLAALGRTAHRLRGRPGPSGSIPGRPPAARRAVRVGDALPRPRLETIPRRGLRPGDASGPRPRPARRRGDRRLLPARVDGRARLGAARRDGRRS